LKLTIGFTAFLFLASGMCSPAQGREWFVTAGGSGSGTQASPFGRIQDGLNAALPGDVVTVGAGTYKETILTVRNGTASARIPLRAAGARGSVLLTNPGRVLTVDHAYFTVDDFVIDGQYGGDDTIRISNGGDYFLLYSTEVRRSSKDLIDMAGPQGVTIDRSFTMP
jgi:hypothetical protein